MADAPDGLRARPLDIDRAAHRQRLQAERERLLELAPPDVLAELIAANRSRSAIEESIRALRDGHAGWHHREAAQAARDMNEARSRCRQAERFAASSDVSWRNRRYWCGEAKRRTQEELRAKQ